MLYVNLSAVVGLASDALEMSTLLSLQNLDGRFVLSLPGIEFNLFEVNIYRAEGFWISNIPLELHHGHGVVSDNVTDP